MKITSSQPTFLPYPGYIGLIQYVDYFVIMDNVQFASRSWQQRMLYNFNKKPCFLTIPVKKKNLRFQIISETEIDRSTDYIKKHLLSIRHAYSKFPYFKKYFSEIEKIYEKDHKYLIDLNLSLLFFISDILQIDKKKFVYLSNLKFDTQYYKDNLIYQICLNTNGTEQYITSQGAKNYLDLNKNLNDKFQVKYFNYTRNLNDQIFYNNKYYHNSILDLIFSCGKKSNEVIKSNFEIIETERLNAQNSQKIIFPSLSNFSRLNLKNNLLKENLENNQIIKKSRLSLRFADTRDLHFVYNLYNYNVRQKIGFSSVQVKLNDHEVWFRNKIKEKMFYIFSVQERIGYLRFDKIDNKNLSISIAIKKNYQRNGYGKKVLSEILNHKKFYQKNIWAYIKKNNIKSKIFFKSMGFQASKKMSIKVNTKDYFIFFKKARP